MACVVRSSRVERAGGELRTLWEVEFLRVHLNGAMAALEMKQAANPGFEAIAQLDTCRQDGEG